MFPQRERAQARRGNGIKLYRGGIDDETDAGEVSPEDDGTPYDGPDFTNNERVSRASRTSVAESFVAMREEISESGFDALLTFDEEGDGIQIKGDAGQGGKLSPINVPGRKPAAGSKIAAAMPTGNRYRVLIYDNSDNYVGTIDAVSGTAFSPGFPVFRNTIYKWYAYSYNSTTQVPVPTNTANPTISTTAGTTSLLYASGTLTTVAGSNKINITFAHRLASIALILDARGMFATVNSVTASNTTAANLSTGTLNLRTGAYTTTTGNTGSTSLTSFTNLATATGDSVKVAYFYTASTAAIANFGITINNFIVNLDDNTTRTFTGKTFTFATSFSPQLGRRYLARINLIESAVMLGGVRWARSNLHYRATDGGYRFRHRTSNIYGATGNPSGSGEYFNWGAQTAAVAAPTGILNQCRQVYPYNTWRLPTPADFTALQNVTTPARTYAASSDAFYVAWNLGGTNEYGNNWLSLLAQGRRSVGNNILTDFSNLISSSGFYWSNNGNTEASGATNATYLRINITALGGIASGGAILQETGVRNQGMNVRCVRN